MATQNPLLERSKLCSDCKKISTTRPQEGCSVDHDKDRPIQATGAGRMIPDSSFLTLVFALPLRFIFPDCQRDAGGCFFPGERVTISIHTLYVHSGCREVRRSRQHWTSLSYAVSFFGCRYFLLTACNPPCLDLDPQSRPIVRACTAADAPKIDLTFSCVLADVLTVGAFFLQDHSM